MSEITVKNEPQMIAEYDQATIQLREAWSSVSKDEIKRIQKVVIPSLEAKGDIVSASLLKWATVSMIVKQIEEKNKPEDD